MELQLNKTYDLFIAVARHVYKKAKLNSDDEYEEFEYPYYLGFKDAGKLPGDVIESIQQAKDEMFNYNPAMSERKFINICLTDCWTGNFFETFVKQNQKLF